MLDKYFGFMKISDEYSIVESLISHSQGDREELKVLGQMINAATQNKYEKIESLYKEIREINTQSIEAFDNMSDQIIESQFDHQKQYELLRLEQKNELISGMIIATAKRALIFSKLKEVFPNQLIKEVLVLQDKLESMFDTYESCLSKYADHKPDVLKTIHKLEKEEQDIDHVRGECLQILYQLGNQNEIKMGTMLCLQELIEHIEEVSDTIEAASGSLKCLLIQ